MAPQFAGIGPDRLAELLQRERYERARRCLERVRAILELEHCQVEVVALQEPMLPDLPPEVTADAAMRTVHRLVMVALPHGAEWAELPAPPEPDPRLLKLEGKP